MPEKRSIQEDRFRLLQPHLFQKGILLSIIKSFRFYTRMRPRLCPFEEARKSRRPDFTTREFNRVFNLVADYWDQCGTSLDGAQEQSLTLQNLEALLLSQVEAGVIPEPEASAIFEMLKEDWELCDFGPDFLAKLHLDPILAKWLDNRAATTFLELAHNQRFLKPLTLAGLKKELTKAEIAQSNGAYDVPILLGALPRAGPNYTKHLVGNRWLYRGGSILFVGPTGTGKSSFIIQAGICWTAGMECFGLKPSGPLRVLYIQAENDPEDIAEVRDDVYRGLNISAADQEVANQNFTVIHKVDATGSRFIAWLAAVLADHPCDILIIDPLMAYIGGDVTQQAVTSEFLREGLQPLISKHQIGVIVVHHPPKPKIDNPKETAQSDAYYGAGSADIANWVRGVMTLMETKNLGLFKLRLPKRGKRVGWMEADGITPKIQMDVAHGRGGLIYWREADASEGFLPKKPDTTRADILALIPMSGQILQEQVIELAGQKSIGRGRARDTLKLLEADNQIRTVEVPRARCRAAVAYTRGRQA